MVEEKALTCPMIFAPIDPTSSRGVSEEAIIRILGGAWDGIYSERHPILVDFIAVFPQFHPTPYRECLGGNDCLLCLFAMEQAADANPVRGLRREYFMSNPLDLRRVWP